MLCKQEKNSVTLYNGTSFVEKFFLSYAYTYALRKINITAITYGRIMSNFCFLSPLLKTINITLISSGNCSKKIEQKSLEICQWEDGKRREGENKNKCYLSSILLILDHVICCIYIVLLSPYENLRYGDFGSISSEGIWDSWQGAETGQCTGHRVRKWQFQLQAFSSPETLVRESWHFCDLALQRGQTLRCRAEEEKLQAAVQFL